MKKEKKIEELLKDLEIEKVSKTTNIEKSQYNEEINNIDVIEKEVVTNIKESYWKKRKILLRPISLVIFFFLLIIIYYISPYSKVEDIIVRGNKYLDNFTIIKESKISINDNVASTYTYNAKKRLENLYLIDKAYITKNLLTRKVHIDIREVEPLFYYVEDKNNFIVDVNKNIQKTNKSIYFPKYDNYDETPKNYIKTFVEEMKKVKKSVLNQISEIIWSPTKTFKQRYLFKMNDKNYIYVLVNNSSEKLNYYQELKRTLPKNKSVNIYLENSSYFKEVKR